MQHCWSQCICVGLISSLPPPPLAFSPELLQPLPWWNLSSLYPFTLLRRRCPALLLAPHSFLQFPIPPCRATAHTPQPNACAGDCISTCDLQEDLFPLKCSAHGNSLSWKRSLQRSGRCCRCCHRVAPLLLQLQIHRRVGRMFAARCSPAPGWGKQRDWSKARRRKEGINRKKSCCSQGCSK